MKLWLISQGENRDYDTYDSAVVAAETEDGARRTRFPRRTWASSPEHVVAKLIGSAEDSMAEGVILASFNAG